MLKWLGGLIDSNEKELKRLQPIINRINELGPEFERLSDDELRAKTDDFKARLNAGSSLDELLPEAFAAVREAAKRTIGQRHFDVQLLGGIVLHQGKIAEMKTGEGKPWWLPSPFISTPLPVRGATWLPLTTTWLGETPTGWALSTMLWESALPAFTLSRPRMNIPPPAFTTPTFIRRLTSGSINNLILFRDLPFPVLPVLKRTHYTGDHGILEPPDTDQKPGNCLSKPVIDEFFHDIS